MAVSAEGHDVGDIFFIADFFVFCILVDGSLVFAGDWF